MSDLMLFHGPNAGYVLELYERYQQNPQSVDAATREFFERWTPPERDREQPPFRSPAWERGPGGEALPATRNQPCPASSSTPSSSSAATPLTSSRRPMNFASSAG